ncbi:MAG: hypothetical protein PHF86_14570 [Candidatus Nanoarchaeia archaeon]|jgi:hypothetical protein|nr:hypothetical protein [Candidatus Nanoarchaeia archaeon]MDD5651615.1 hypothetical protein [Candidatus Nanoarchaeia archaeon]
MNKEAIQSIANELLSRKIIPLGVLFSDPFAKLAMSAGELLFKTNQKSIKYAKGCVATTKRNDPKNGRWMFSVKCHQTKSKGPYDVRFKLLGTGPKTQGMLGREVEISCNCNAWKYNGADFNALDKDYSERQYSDGTAPNIRDPQRRYLICKHVAASIPLFKRFIVPDQFKGPQKGPVKPTLKVPVKPVPTKPQQKAPVTPTKPEQEKPLTEKRPRELKPIIQRPTRIKPRPGRI